MLRAKKNQYMFIAANVKSEMTSSDIKATAVILKF